MILTFRIANILVALSYFWIAAKLFRQHRPRYGLLAESIVFGAFIFVCGVHHVVMAVTKRHADPWVVTTDIVLAMVSVMAAVVLTQGRVAIEMRERDRRKAGIVA